MCSSKYWIVSQLSSHLSFLCVVCCVPCVQQSEERKQSFSQCEPTCVTIVYTAVRAKRQLGANTNLIINWNRQKTKNMNAVTDSFLPSSSMKRPPNVVDFMHIIIGPCTAIVVNVMCLPLRTYHPIGEICIKILISIIKLLIVRKCRVDFYVFLAFFHLLALAAFKFPSNIVVRIKLLL